MWILDNQKKIPVYQQIMEQIIEYIQQGILLPGDKLPAERKLAQQYQVNRSTVVHALDELVSLGWIVRKRGSGTVVNEGNWGRSTTPRVDWRRLLTTQPLPKDIFSQELNQLLTTEDRLDLFTGELPLSLIPDFRFPSYTWEELLKEEKKQSSLGYPPILEQIALRLQKEQKIAVSSKEILITSGAKQAMFLLLQVMLQSGDSVAVEDPSFLYSLPIFATAGIRLYGVPLDGEGMEIPALEQLILTKKIKMILVNPTFQNPTGRTMSTNRRQELIALSHKYQIPIVEDEVFSELSFSGVPKSLKALAPHHVIHLGSLSKVFGSSLKIGWIVADEDLIARLAEAKQMMDFNLSVFPQVVAHTALIDEHFETNRQQLVAELAKRAENFTKGIQAFKKYWNCEGIEGGLYVYLTWQGPKLNRRDWQIFLQEKLLIAPSFLFSNDTMAMRVNYTRLAAAELPLFWEKLTAVTKFLATKSKT